MTLLHAKSIKSDSAFCGFKDLSALLIYILDLNCFYGHFRIEQSCCLAGLGGLVGCAVRLETGGRGFNPRRGRQHSFVEIDHEIFSTAILSLPLIQEGQLSVSGERMCIILVNHLED